MKGQKAPAPTRGVKANAAAAAGDDDGGDEGEDESEPTSVEDLMPRNDISDKITDDLLTELSDKAWKVRGEALQKVVTILNEAKFITPSLGELPTAIKARLADANKLLVSHSVSLFWLKSQG